MSAQAGPRVLLVTSAGAHEGAVTPVVAALEAAELDVRAIDVGRAGARADNPLDWVVSTVSGELAERRLMRAIAEHPPDVTVTFDPRTTEALSRVRDQATRPAVVVAVVGELAPGEDWAAADADRYLAIDDEAAVALADLGVDGERIIPVGPLCERAFVEAAERDRARLRREVRVAADMPVIVVEVAGLGYELTSQVALQLSLVSKKATYLFDAGADVEAATALRRQVPTLDLRAKLFGQTQDAPLYWRAADVVIARPSESAVARVMVLGARMVALMPDGASMPLAQALEARRLGTTAASPLLITSALEPLLAAPARRDDSVGADGAGNVADIVWIVGGERREVIEERRREARASTRARVEAAASAAEAAARTHAAAGGLEDLGGEDAGLEAEAPGASEVAQLRAEVSARLGQVSRAVMEAREAAERWDKKAEDARGRGDQDLARDAERNADAERGRMHAALAEMAELQTELGRLERAARAAPPPSSGRQGAPRSGGHGSSPRSGRPGAPPPSSAGARGASSLDDMLADMKRKTVEQQSTLDDELAALKRKMNTQKKG